jgi:hypothetical protein
MTTTTALPSEASKRKIAELFKNESSSNEKVGAPIQSQVGKTWGRTRGKLVYLELVFVDFFS